MKLLGGVLGMAGVIVGVLADCNPLTSSGCPADTALAGSFKEDFSSKSKYFKEEKDYGISYGDDGLTMTLAKRFDNPSIKSNFYIMFGKIEVVLKAAEGKGVISSFYLQSDDQDEIDIELFGGDDKQYQSNFFSKGNTTTYDRGGYHTTSSSVISNYHTYTLDWTKDSLTWAIDGNVDRTLNSNDKEGYPQSPMYIMAGIWAGGDPSNNEGTIEWAGGETDYSKAPFSMHIKSLVVTDYSTGESYSYSDNSGAWTSIESKNGKVNGRIEEAKKDFDKLTNNQGTSSNSPSGSSASSAYSTSVGSSTVEASKATSANPSTSAASEKKSTTPSAVSATGSSGAKTAKGDSRSSSPTSSPVSSYSHNSISSSVPSQSTFVSRHRLEYSSSYASSHPSVSSTQFSSGMKLSPIATFLLMVLTAII